MKIKLTKLKKLPQLDIKLLLLLIISINFIFNIFTNKLYHLTQLSLNSSTVVPFVASFSFYIYLSTIIKNSLKLPTRSLGIIYFLFSFYIINFLLLPFQNLITFNFLFYLTTSLWLLCLVVLNKKNLKPVITLIILYLLTLCLNKYYIIQLSNLNNYLILNTDSSEQWFYYNKNIFKDGLYSVFTNNPISKQGILIPYLQTVVYKINFPFLNEYEFIRLNSNLIYPLSLLLFFDLKQSIRKRGAIILIFTFTILNSDWLTFLFLDSLMLEGFVSLCIAIFLFNLNYFLTKRFDFSSFIFFTYFSFMVYSKQFISVIVLLFIILLSFFNKNFKLLLPLIFVNVTNFLYEKLYLPQKNGFEYLDNISIYEFILNLFDVQNLEFNNSLMILSEIWKDRVITLVLVTYLILFLTSNKHFVMLNFYILFFIITNYLFINILYVSWWQDIELGSSFRYFLSTFHIMVIGLSTTKNSKT